FTAPDTLNGKVKALALEAKDTGEVTKVYVGGAFSRFNTDDGMRGFGRLVRLDPDGSADQFFEVGAGFDKDVNVIRLSLDGSGVSVGGAFERYQGRNAAGVVKLRTIALQAFDKFYPAASVDPAFRIDPRFKGVVHTIRTDTDDQ